MELVPRGGCWGEAEDFVDFADDGAGFAFVEFAVRIQFAEGGASASAGIAIFLDEHGFATGTDEGVDETDEGGGIATEPMIEGTSFGR